MVLKHLDLKVPDFESPYSYGQIMTLLPPETTLFLPPNHQ